MELDDGNFKSLRQTEAGYIFGEDGTIVEPGGDIR